MFKSIELYSNLGQKPPGKMPPDKNHPHKNHPDKSPPIISPGIKAKKNRCWIFFSGLIDPSWNRLASTTYFAIISSKILGGYCREAFVRVAFVQGVFCRQLLTGCRIFYCQLPPVFQNLHTKNFLHGKEENVKKNSIVNILCNQ